MTYDSMDQMGFVKETLTGLEPYYGRPTPGNKIVDSYLADNEKSLDSVAEAISDMNRAIRIAERARLYMERCVDAVQASLSAHFVKQGDWDEKTAIVAVSNFEKHGFKPRDARAFAAFIRGMFFDDSDKTFQAIRCVGLSSSSYGSFTLAGGTFEDSVSGNQFALMLPFTKKDRFEWRGWHESFNSKLQDVPCYILTAPDDENTPQTVSKSYDVREMRVAVSKFIKGGCLYRHGQQIWISYRIPDSFY